MRRNACALVGIIAASALLLVPATLAAQGDPAPRGGAGTNLPGAAGAVAEGRANNFTVTTAPVTTSPAGVPEHKDQTGRAISAERERERGLMSQREVYDRIAELTTGREARAAARDGGWYSREGGAAVAVEAAALQPKGPDFPNPPKGPTGLVQRSGYDPGDCSGSYVTAWGTQDTKGDAKGGWDSTVYGGLGGCMDGHANRSYIAWLNRRPSLSAVDMFDSRYYWGNPGIIQSRGYSGRAGGYSEAYAAAGLKLDVKPGDALVYVDGYFAGEVREYDGMIRRLPLNPGSHRVEFFARGFAPLVVDVAVDDGQTATYSGVLKRGR